MIVFFLLATLLLLTTLALLLPALVRNTPGDRAGDRDELNVDIARERLSALKHMRAAGEISPDEFESERDELERALLGDLDQPSGPESVAAAGRGKWAAFVVAAAMPVLAGTLYLALGRPEAVSPDLQPALADHPDDRRHPAKVEEMVVRLAERLKSDTDNAADWFTLARSYMVLGRFAEAAEAFERVRRLVGDHPDVLVRYADALAMASNGRLAGKPQRLVIRALDQDPDNPQALWMAASAAQQLGNLSQALEYYRRLEPLVEGDTRLQISRIIASLSDSSAAGGVRTAVAGNEPSAAIPGTPAASVRVVVDLDPSLKVRTDPEDTVFIFARAMNGPPMPLAVVRKSVADLPVAVVLDDSLAMTPDMKLSDFEQLRIGARISKTGSAAAQSGDLEGGQAAVTTGESVDVLIDRVVP
jgi:cytochrome c-type biogenesis protein CcmH